MKTDVSIEKLGTFMGEKWRPSLPASFIVVDIEATGLDRRRAGVLSIGAVKPDGDEFYVEPRLDVDYIEPEAMAVNGFRWEDCVDRELTFAAAWRQFLQWAGFGRRIFAGKNPSYDWDVLEARTAAGELSPPRTVFSRRLVDVDQWAWAWALCRGIDVSAEDFKSELIYYQLGIEPEARPHNALAGAKWSMAAFKKLAAM